MALVVLGVGGTDGANVTTGAPSNFTLVNPSGAHKYDATRSVNGVIGIETISAAASNYTCRYQASNTSVNLTCRGWLWGPGTTQAEDVDMLTLRTFDGTTRTTAARFRWTTADALTVVGKTGLPTTLATGLNPANAYEVSVVATIATATTGSITVKVWNTSGTQVGSTFTSTTYDLGTTAAPFEAIDLGVPGSLTQPHVVGFTAWQANVGGTTEIARYAASAPAGTVRPVSVAANPGGYTASGGTTDPAVAAGDNSNTTIVVGPVASGSGLDIDFTLADAVVMSSGGTLQIKQLKLNGTGGTYQAYLMKGSTIIKSWALPVTTTATDYSFTFNATEAAAIGSTTADWSGLKIRIRSAA
jgi:hypothetical protein